ncbi:MAG: ABC transporter permease, partial [Clostridia bacterium]|nr:ABC transporter permease [Clostridia bacterium]
MNANETFKKNPLSLQLDLSKFSQESFIPATDEEKRQQDVMGESTTFFKDGMRKLFKNPLAVMSIILIGLILLVVIFAPMIVPYKYEEILSVNGVRDKGAKNLAPFTYSEKEQEFINNG